MFFGAGLVAGLLGQIGDAIDSERLQRSPTPSIYVVPFEALYQHGPLPAHLRDQRGSRAPRCELGPFGGAQEAGAGAFVFAAAYTVACSRSRFGASAAATSERQSRSARLAPMIDTHCHLGLCEPDDGRARRGRGAGGRAADAHASGIDEAASARGDRDRGGARGGVRRGRAPSQRHRRASTMRPPSGSRSWRATRGWRRSARPASTTTATALRATISAMRFAPTSRSRGGSPSRW